MHKHAAKNEQRRTFKAAINAVDLGEKELIKPEGFQAADDYFRKLKAEKMDVESRLVRVNSQIALQKMSLGRSFNPQLRNSLNRLIAERSNLVRAKSDLDKEILARKPEIRDHNIKMMRQRSEEFCVYFFDAAKLMLAPDVMQRIIDVANGLKGREK